jgi:membrane protein YqaA with SNARE-associated domain
MMADTNNAIFYAVITVLVSLAGSAVGYYVGSKAGKPLLIKFFGEEKADRVKRIYDKYGVFAVASSAFTPIPYEAYTLSAGAFKMNFKKYMLGVLLGRILRYLPEGVAVQLFGHAIDAKDLASMSWFVMVVLVIFVLYGIIRKRWESRV